MNKKLFYIAMTLVLLVSCEKNQVIPIEEYLSLQKKSITVPTEGGTFDVEYKAISDVTFTIPEDSKWIELETDGGTKNTSPYHSGRLTFGVHTTETSGPRVGYIYLHCQEDTDTVSVHQNMQEFLTLPEKEITIDPNGGAFSIEVETNVTISFQIADEWISLQNGEGIQNPELIEGNRYLVKFNAEKGSVESDRTANIYFIYGKDRDTLVINQPQREELVVSPDKIEADAFGGTYTVELGHNVDYTVSIPENIDWISIPATQTANYVREKISLEIERNMETQPRECTILFRSSDETLSAQLLISQKGVSENFATFMEMNNLGWYSFAPGAEFTIEYEKFVSQYAITNRGGVGGFRIVSGSNYFIMEGIDKEPIVGNTLSIQTLQNFLSSFNRNETGTYVIEKVSEEDGTMWLFNHQKEQGMIVKNK